MTTSPGHPAAHLARLAEGRSARRLALRISTTSVDANLIASGLYWASMASHEEADYLCAILNAAITSELLKPFMPYGKDERHVHKHVWQLIVPTYEGGDAIHRQIVALGREMAQLAAEYPVKSDLHFAATRGHMRELMEGTPSGERLGEIVCEMLC